jgi:hypothetical protein
MDVAFSPSVKAVQSRLGSRELYAKQEQRSPWSDQITPELSAFIAEQDSFFFGTASAQGQPYIQHRGGPPGFLKVRNERQLGFADFAGNRQYISMGNLAENPLAILFLVDFEHARRVKIWGMARAVENDRELLEELVVPGGKGKAERAIVFEVSAWDINCPQHIPRRIAIERVQAALEERDMQIAALEDQIRRLRESSKVGAPGVRPTRS